MATDIVLALGSGIRSMICSILALLGPRGKARLKVFLTALDIADDLRAVPFIVPVYTDRIEVVPLIAAGVLRVLLVLAAHQ